MGNINDVIRRTSALVDTSGQYPPPAIQTAVIQPLGGGVYVQSSGPGDEEAIFTGRLSLGILAAFILGAIGFYLWTHEIQGGG